MLFAHTLGAGGPEIEFLIIAVAMLVLGIVFFVQKSVKPAVPVVLVLGAVVMLAGAFAFEGGGSDEPAQGLSGAGGAEIEIAAPEAGDTVTAGEPVRVEIRLGDVPEGGHFDVRIDDELETMGPDPSPEVVFEVGEHTLSVEYVNSQHQSFSPPVRDEVTITAE